MIDLNRNDRSRPANLIRNASGRLAESLGCGHSRASNSRCFLTLVADCPSFVFIREPDVMLTVQ